MKQKTERIGVPRMILLFISVVLACFILAGTVATVNKEIIYSGSVGSTIENLPTQWLQQLVGMENHYWSDGNQSSEILSMGFEFFTNIRIDDIRTLIGNELPGYAFFDSEIVVPGDGTDFSSLPYESAPPLDVLLQEREMADEQLEELNRGSNSNDPPVSSPSDKNVFVYHSHSWESYLPLLGLPDDADENKAVDAKTNITLIGDLLGKELEQRGVGALVDKSNIGQLLKEKEWTTGKSYDVSRSIVEAAQSGNKNLQYFIDIHRDSQRKKLTTATVNGKSYARLAFVLGKENGNYEKNLAFATELHEALNKKYPGLSRGIIAKYGEGVNGVYNQDLSPNLLVVEVGGVDNDMKELKNSIAALADVISEYYWKAEKVDGESE
ncbi:stage II sporulation protein P [Fredinandcohnia sp. 179-A 10B2 NHS]|uniref:stage II sporulation protein P n=1 Tax=Fredinandcohnia sp. 179-A 10B2 NHS TaxID=3235176 RepID=UPI0039A257E4